MNVIVGCEESQEVTKAFRSLGHNAFSCDIKDCSGGFPEWHLKMDVFEAIKNYYWDVIIIHPPCTKLCVSGNRWYGKNKPGYFERERELLNGLLIFGILLNQNARK